MPYLSIKCYPRDEAARRAAVERLNQALMEVWGCAPEDITISLEEVAPEDWDDQVERPEIRARLDTVWMPFLRRAASNARNIKKDDHTFGVVILWQRVKDSNYRLCIFARKLR